MRALESETEVFIETVEQEEAELDDDVDWVVKSESSEDLTMTPKRIFCIPERWVMVILCAICCFINYADRVNMSVAVLAIGEEYGYNKREQGVIMSAFFLGYLPMQLGGAILCRRYGGKRVLSLGAFLWSLFTILTPLASELGFAMLLVCRVCMGLCEAVAFPSVYHFLSFWVPASERGLSTSVFLTGAHVGTTVALVLSPIIIRVWSWHWIFYLFGSAGMVWIVVWNLIAYDRDGLEKVDEEDERYLEKDDEDAAIARNGVGNVGWVVFMKANEVKAVKFVITHMSTITICLVQCLFGLVHYVILSWLPSYFQDVFNMKTESLSFTFVPYMMMAIASNVGGYIADRFVKRGVGTTRVRKGITIIANGGAAITLLLFCMSGNVSISLLWISLSMAFMSLNTGGFESCYMDMSVPELTGIFKGVANTLGSLAGFVAIPLATIILDATGGSWRWTFASLSLIYVLMTSIFVRYGTSERVLTEE